MTDIATNDSDSCSESTEEKQKPGHLFQPGQSGNPAGRPKGSRNKLGQQFIEAVYDEWQVSGAKALKTMAHQEPGRFCKLVANLLPRELDLTVTNRLSQETMEFLEAYRFARSVIGAEDYKQLLIEAEADG